MFLFFGSKMRSSTEAVDLIEKIVFEHLKPHGFQKHGRTLHRFTDGDISQIVHLQNGCPGKGIYDRLWVNLGIRIPECAERNFSGSDPLKKYYHEYECNIRTRLGALSDGKDTFYDLRKDPERIAGDIVSRLGRYVLPAFAVLNSREALLAHRREYRDFDQMSNSLILLDEAMIYGRKGDLSKAAQCLRQHYQEGLYNANRVHLEYLEELARRLSISLNDD